MLGSFFDLAGTLRIDARVVEVETGKIVRSVGVNGPAADFWGLERDLAAKLADTMRTALPAAFEHAALLPPKPRPPKWRRARPRPTGAPSRRPTPARRPRPARCSAKVVEEAPGFTLAKQDLNTLLAPAQPRIQSPRPAKRGEG